jgi:hypothetical protein
MKKKTAVLYAYLDTTSRKHISALSKKHKCSMSKAINALIIAHRTKKDPQFASGYRREKV